jgi:uncharacterized protein
MAAMNLRGRTLVQDLQDLLGVKVHVGTEKALHWYVRDRILREATSL